MTEIRLMCEKDLEQVTAIEKEIFLIPWSEKAFADSLASNNTLYLVAESENRIVGYCGMYISFEEGNITNVAVAPLFRRKKIARHMLEEILTRAKEKNVSDVILEVRETNVPAISLYEQLGFKEAGIRKNFYERPVENALIMWKHNL